MAGDWIKMRSNLWDDPRIAMFCDVTDQPEAMVVGALYWLWATADQHSEDGMLPGLTLRSIDRKTGIKGFGAALVAAGWLADSPEGVQITRFDEHNGASAKKRCQTAKRVANFKTGNATESDPCQEGNAHCVTKALPERDLEEEKRREEVNPSLYTPIAPIASPTRKGAVCGMLRQAGMQDSAPHYLTDDVWETILAKRTDEEIIEVAKAKMAARPNERIGLKYIAKALLQDPEAMTATSMSHGPPRMSHADKSKLAAARAIFGTEIEGNQNEQGSRIIDVTPTFAPLLGG